MPFPFVKTLLSCVCRTIKRSQTSSRSPRLRRDSRSRRRQGRAGGGSGCRLIEQSHEKLTCPLQSFDKRAINQSLSLVNLDSSLSQASLPPLFSPPASGPSLLLTALRLWRLSRSSLRFSHLFHDLPPLFLFFRTPPLSPSLLLLLVCLLVSVHPPLSVYVSLSLLRVLFSRA